jgi:primosomal replication protein N''
MGFLVKKVENVQGDERDIIVFSSTFGRNGQGTFRRHFGVLGQAGGERRPNVAVTRARKKVVLVTSMPVEEISDMLSTRRPPAVPRDYLQVYLEYARMVSDGTADSGRALLGRLVMERTAEHDRDVSECDGFTEAVQEFLRTKGWNCVEAQDGGTFGLDFAIEDPRSGLYAIGIECDAPRHRILETARAREVWRPRVLRYAVPCVHRVSSYGWLHALEDERTLLQSAVEKAIRADGRR